MYQIELMDNQSEVVQYTVPNLPIKAVRSKQSDYPAMEVTSHWHSDFEFAHVQQEQVYYSVNGASCLLKTGDMIFVNSGQMHHAFWKSSGNCEFDCTLLHPSILNNQIAGTYLRRIFGDQKPPFLVLKPERLLDKRIITLVSDLHQCACVQNDGYELEIMGCAYLMCRLLMERIQAVPNLPDRTDSKKLEAMHRMVGYIQQNYSNKVSLADIASAGLVCRSSCCEIFKHYLHKTPVDYLTEYRISKSLDLLPDTAQSITEIAIRCGFGSSSYFTETFHRRMGCTPTEYRLERANP